MTRCVQAAGYYSHPYKKVLIFTALLFFLNFNFCFCWFRWCFSDWSCSRQTPAAAGEQPIDKPDNQREDEDAPEEQEGEEEAKSHSHHWKAAHPKTTSETATKI